MGTNKRIGYAHHLVNFYSEDLGSFSFATVTEAKIKELNPPHAFALLQKSLLHNLKLVEKLIKKIGSLPELCRMVRLDYTLLPLYVSNSETVNYFYGKEETQLLITSELKRLGELAKIFEVRLSFHAPYGVSLASENSYVVQHSIRTLNYLSKVAELMGFAETYGDCKITIHYNGKAGERTFIENFYKLSESAKRLVVLENTENVSLKHCLKFKNHLPIVLDIFHHLINAGEYIRPSSALVDQVRDSWLRSTKRPVIHYSWFDAKYKVCDRNSLPDPKTFTDFNRTQLSRHSIDFYNPVANVWALSFIYDFDIMCESKSLAVGSSGLAVQYSKIPELP